MMDLERAQAAFRALLEGYEDRDTPGFRLKVAHTTHVVRTARVLAVRLGLSPEDAALAELIALLHDVGRFEELRYAQSFDSSTFDHAARGVEMLFEERMIRSFLPEETYDGIIRAAIANHSKLALPEGLDPRTLLHARILRDADKLDNFRVKRDERPEAIFLGRVNSREEFEASALSVPVYRAVLDRRCVDLRDRITPLDNWVCVLAFVFDLNFRESYGIVREEGYVDALIDRFRYQREETRVQMEEIRRILREYVDRHA